MTEHDRTTRLGHLDDEAISAVLDGEATADEAAHVDGCAACAARLGQLRDAALVVRTPVAPPTDAERDAAIAAALAPASGTVTQLRRRTMPRWLPAVAAALVVLAGVGVALGVRGSGSGDDRSTSAAGGTSGTASRAAPAPEASTFASAVFDGGDLGDIDVRSLRTTIESALSPSRSSAAQAGGGAGATADDAAGTTTVAPKAAACEDQVRTGNPALGPLLYRATGRLDGAAVDVLAFDAGGRRWVYVVATADCSIKNQTTYSA